MKYKDFPEVVSELPPQVAIVLKAMRDPSYNIDFGDVEITVDPEKKQLAFRSHKP